VASNFYLVEIEGELQPANEVAGLIWYTKDDFQNGQPTISTWLIDKVIPKLVDDGYL
jgi:hypothetical protein